MPEHDHNLLIHRKDTQKDVKAKAKNDLTGLILLEICGSDSVMYSGAEV